MEENSENIWKIWKNSKLNSEKISKIQKKSREMIYKVWKKNKSNSEKISKMCKEIKQDRENTEEKLVE